MPAVLALRNLATSQLYIAKFCLLQHLGDPDAVKARTRQYEKQTTLSLIVVEFFDNDFDMTQVKVIILIAKPLSEAEIFTWTGSVSKTF